MKRRIFLAGTAAALALPVQAAETFEITRTDAEWRAMLSPLAYKVMRQAGTERAHSSPLNDEHRAGIFHCTGCDLPLYDAAAKFESGTGWPSFFAALPGGEATKPDRRLFTTRTEAHCSRCGSHLGHIFDDGPKPTGKRHCINGVSLQFRAT